MALAELVQKMKSKKQTATKTAFSHYLEAVRKLASGAEIDADEAGHIIESAGRDESALERDVNLQQQRNAWAAQLQANRNAIQDRLQAERDVATTQQRLQEAIDKLQPAVELAQARLNDANFRYSTTLNAEAWLAGNLLDVELLQRESVLNDRLREINQELAPLLADRAHKASSLMNAELVLRQLTGRNPDDWTQWGITSFFHKNQDIKAAESRVSEVQNELAQLDAAIEPRVREQRRLQNELNAIHAEKLKP